MQVKNENIISLMAQLLEAFPIFRSPNFLFLDQRTGCDASGYQTAGPEVEQGCEALAFSGVKRVDVNEHGFQLSTLETRLGKHRTN